MSRLLGENIKKYHFFFFLVILLCVMAVYVLCLFLMVPWIGLRSVIVAFPGHTHLWGKHIFLIYLFCLECMYSATNVYSVYFVLSVCIVLPMCIVSILS